jgi:hypothetical protein
VASAGPLLAPSVVVGGGNGSESRPDWRAPMAPMTDLHPETERIPSNANH